MSENVIPSNLAEGVAQFIRNVCNLQNDYKYITFMTIGDYNYKITISLQEVDMDKEAKIASIVIKRED